MKVRVWRFRVLDPSLVEGVGAIEVWDNRDGGITAQTKIGVHIKTEWRVIDALKREGIIEFVSEEMI